MIAAANAPLLPSWVVLPVAVVLLLVVAAHLLLISSAPMPESRRRIRLANGWIMLLLVPIGAAAFGVVTPGDPRMFLIVWLLVIFMLVMLIVLATLDVFNTGRLYRREKRSIEESIGLDADAEDEPSESDSARQDGRRG